MEIGVAQAVLGNPVERRRWNDAGILRGRRSLPESLLKKFENPRARHARILPNQDLPTQLLANRPADCNDRLGVQWEFTGASADAICTE